MADDRHKVNVVAKTDKGKEIGFRASTDPSKPALFEIAFKDGGQVPDVLKGSFIDRRSCENAIKHYLALSAKPAKKGA